MHSSQKTLRRAAQVGRPAQRAPLTPRRPWARLASSSAPRGPPRRRGLGRFVGIAAIVAVPAAAASYHYVARPAPFSEPGQAAPELEFEKPRKQAASKEEHRDLISSQHVQVKNSWEHPGVYAWGSNAGKVVDPGSDEAHVKLPRRIAFFDGQLLRALKLTRDWGAAISEDGDLVQWGTGFSEADPRPQATLRGKNLVKLAASADRVVALSRRGVVYSIPAARNDQQEGAKLDRAGSPWSLWSTGGKEPISFRDLTPAGLRRGEKVTEVSSGLEHCLMLTNRGRVFSAASSSSSFPARGQMGIPGLTWETRPAGAYDQAHEVTGLGGLDVDKIATGDRHSVASDKAGRVFTFGDNTYGQLGFEAESCVSTPSMVAVDRLYGGGGGGNGRAAQATSVAAGGANTFFTVEAAAGGPAAGGPAGRGVGVGVGASDLWACGQGVLGALGTGKWTHVSAGPARVKALSSLFEYDERAGRMAAIRVKQLIVGATHCAAVLDNATSTGASGRAGADDTNWGADVLFWGGNEHYQLGTGRRANAKTPTYIGPLEGGGAGDTARHRLCLTPRQTVRVEPGGCGRRVTLEQRVECGRFVTGVYSAA